MSSEPTGPYGSCITCGADMPTKADSNEHLSATFDGTSGHRVQILNPPREDRIRRRIESKVDEAVTEFIYEIQDAIDREEFTEAEVTDALKLFPDFADAWDEVLREIEEERRAESGEEAIPEPIPGQTDILASLTEVSR